MDLRRNFRFTAVGLSLLALVAAPRAANADCPAGSGIQFPFLTDTEFQCQRTTFLATLDYFYSVVAAREDCFTLELNFIYPPNTLQCLFPVTNDKPGTTGDPDIDRRLRSAESALTRRILTNCTNVDMAHIGFPGFCADATPLTPYDAFDQVQCMLDFAKDLSTYIINTEHPRPFPDDLTPPETVCQDSLARLSSTMTSTEFDTRGHCLLAQASRNLDLPPKVDCRREVDPEDPQTGRAITDNNVIQAHNQILRTLPNSCPTINLERLGFPWQCPFPDDGSIFPLPALTECMFDTHHHDIFRFLDLVFPCSTKCGNGFLNVEEECDDGNTLYQDGDFCRNNCTEVPCGDTNNDGLVNIVDALYVLRASVGLEHCSLLVCDVNGDLKVRASDALRLLQHAVGLPVALQCPDLSTTCGNGFLEPKETCDDGNDVYDDGDFCNSACLLVGCGDTNDDGAVTIIDAQYILNASVSNVPCDLSICDITGNNVINSTDALRALMWSVGLSVNFNCPAPPPTPPAPPVE